MLAFDEQPLFWHTLNTLVFTLDKLIVSMSIHGDDSTVAVLGKVAVVVDPQEQLRQLRPCLPTPYGRQDFEEQVGLAGKVIGCR